MLTQEDQTTSRGTTSHRAFVDPEYPPHPEAMWMPKRTEAQYSALKAGIHTVGLQYPIKVLKGTNFLLDGRDRLRACRELGITPTVEYVEIPEGSSVAIYTAAEGAKRDGLDFTQKVLLARGLILKLGPEAAERQHLGASVREGEVKGKAAKMAADVVGVSARSVEYAIEIQKKRPDLFERMQNGELELVQARREMEGKAPRPKKASRKGDDRLFIPEYLRERLERVMEAEGKDTPGEAMEVLLDLWEQIAQSRREGACQ